MSKKAKKIDSFDFNVTIIQLLAFLHKNTNAYLLNNRCLRNNEKFFIKFSDYTPWRRLARGGIAPIFLPQH
jgi:hypothetical protein